MPSGGLELLAFSDAQDVHFTINPSITYFNSVYKKHTKFMTETVSFPFDTDSLDIDNETDLEINIPRYGDLLKSCYLRITLPDIYSGKLNGSNEYRFRWIRSLGHFLIKESELFIGGRSIQKFTGEYMNVYNDLHKTQEQKEILYECIGNTPSFHNPEKASGQIYINTRGGNNEFVGIYPSSVPNSNTNGIYNSNSGDYTNGGESIVNKSNTFLTDVSTTYPSIEGKTLKIPLDFFFQSHIGNALPLIALEKMEIKLRLKLSALKDLYVSQVNDNVTSSFIKYNSNHPENGIHYFLNNTDFLSGTDEGRKFATLKIQPKLECNYIYISKSERRKFINGSFQYLIEKPNSTRVQGVTTNHTFTLKSNNHIKEIIFVPKRNDAKNVNEWDNYTNWIPKNIPPYSYLGKYGPKMIDYTKNQLTYPGNISGLPRKQYLKKNMIESIEITLEGNILENKDYSYYELQHTLEYFKQKPQDGIYVYSFSLDPTSSLLSGSFNASSQFIQANLELVEQDTNANYTYDIDVYMVEYNIFSIENGIGGLYFS